MTSMIVAPQPVAVEAGARVLMNSGNAIDAAVTCALVQAVVDPHMCGLGGYLLANLRIAAGAGRSQSHGLILDAPALAGSRVTPTMWEDRLIGPHPAGWGYFLVGKVNVLGYQSICIPGTVKGLATMLARWGTLSWQQALAPATRVAEEGFVVDNYLAGGWRRRAVYPEEATLFESITLNDEVRRLYLTPEGAPYDEGEILRNPDYARTLQRLAADPEDFYRGDLARRMSDDITTNGGFVTAEDFAEYRLREPAPVYGTYRGFTVSTSQPPHGGATLVSMLNILEGYELGRLQHNSPEYIYRVAMAMKAAFADRNPVFGDREFVEVPLEPMLSKDRAAMWRERIDRDEPIHVAFTPSELPDTTHVTVVDHHGNCVALTHSLGSSSGIITPGLGFMYNNSMVNFHPIAGHPNSIAPRKGRTTGMAPTIVYRGEEPVLMLGAPGATKIITSIAQVILNVLDFGMSVEEAVLAPRFDCQGDLIRTQARIPEYVCAEVRKRHPIERLVRSHGGLGLVQAISREPGTGKLAGAEDTGSGGMALQVA